MHQYYNFLLNNVTHIVYNRLHEVLSSKNFLVRNIDNSESITQIITIRNEWL